MLKTSHDGSKTLHPFLTGGGEMAELVSRFDWSKTSLGDIDEWPSWVRNAISLMMRSKVPMVILWGTDGVMTYNDAYGEFAGERHPQLLGMKVLEAWPEVAAWNAHVMEVGLAGGTLSFEDQELFLHRGNKPSRTWLNLDYSPILDDDGRPAGVIAIVVETTAKVIAERWYSSERARQISMFEQSPGFMAMLTGPEHMFELANAGYRALVGGRELIGRTVREAFPDIAGQGFYELLDQVYTTGEPFIGNSIKVDLQGPDHTTEQHFIDLFYQPIRNPDGEVIGILAQGMDVTARVNTERDLRQSEERFRALAEAMPNQVWTAKTDGKLDWFNARVYQYSGMPEGTLEGNGWTDMVHPDDMATTAERWEQARSATALYETEFRLRRSDGSYRWHIARAVPMRDAAGEVVHWIGTNTDIDEQKRAGEALRESERRLHLSQNAAGIGSLEIDLATDTIYGTPQLWKIWGLSERQHAHVSEFESIVLPEDAELRSNTETRADATTPAHTEYRIRRPDNGEIRWVSRSMDFVLDESGKPVKIYGVVQDITERKQAEAHQKMLAHELEHRIKNILAMVSSIVTQTLRSNDQETAQKALRERLAALARAHDILNHTRWTNVSIMEVVQSSIGPFDKDRITVQGPALPVTPRMAISLALAVNELGTNAVKYGALSATGGEVNISWDVKPTPETGKPQLTWTWRESKGPPVTAPSRRGFGSVLITQILGGDFNGVMTIEYNAEGIICTLTAPWTA